MQLFCDFFLKLETKTFYIDKETWFVFNNSNRNEIKVYVKLSESYTLKKGHYFKGIRSRHEKYFVTDPGNVDFFEKDIFIQLEDESVLSSYTEEEEAIEASELSFSGYSDPEGENFGDKYADRMDDIGLPHK